MNNIVIIDGYWQAQAGRFTSRHVSSTPQAAPTIETRDISLPQAGIPSFTGEFVSNDDIFLGRGNCAKDPHEI